MADCCGEPGCNCNVTNIYTDKDCPQCGRKLRIVGSLQTLKLNHSCPGCGYFSPLLSMEELRAIID